MGRVLPSLTTRTGAISMADALGTTKDQQMLNAMRRAATQRAALRRTPEGVMKLLTQGAQTAGALAGTADKIGSLVGKIPISQAMREAATAKASQELGTAPAAKAMFEEVVTEQGSAGRGAPVTAEMIERIRGVGEQGPAGRLAAGALRRGASEDVAMRSGRDRSKAADAEVEDAITLLQQAQAGADSGVSPEHIKHQIDYIEKLLRLHRTSGGTLYAGETKGSMAPSLVEAQARLPELRKKLQAATEAPPANVVMPEDIEAAAETFVDTADAEHPDALTGESITESLEDVQVGTGADERRVQVESFVEQLGDSPDAKQANLLAYAQRAVSPGQQDAVLAAVDFMDILPGGRFSDVWGLGPGPKEAYRAKLRKAFPKSADVIRRQGQIEIAEDRELRRKETGRRNLATEVEKVTERGRKVAQHALDYGFKTDKEYQRRFEDKRDYKFKVWKERNINRTRRGQLSLAYKNYERSVHNAAATEKHRKGMRWLRNKAINQTGANADRRISTDHRRVFTDIQKGNMDVLKAGRKVIETEAKIMGNRSKEAQAAVAKFKPGVGSHANAARARRVADWRKNNDGTPPLSVTYPQKAALIEAEKEAQRDYSNAQGEVKTALAQEKRLIRALNQVLEGGVYDQKKIEAYLDVANKVHGD